MQFLNVSNLNKVENDRILLRNVSFSIERGKNLAVSGATGSGKTTLLKILAGLAVPTSGEVRINGERVKGPNERLLPGHPLIAYHSQHFELRSHYRVAELLDMAKKVTKDEYDRITEVCRIGHLTTRWSNELSGGERQRIVLAAALLKAPQLLLLDEPFSNLDPLHRNQLKAVVQDVRTVMGLTVVLVSHEPVDILPWADEILVLNNGEAVQRNTPQTIYTQPTDEYVAGLFGKYTTLSFELAKALSSHSDIEMQDIGRFVRPEEFNIVPEGEGAAARIEEAAFLGNGYELSLQLEGNPLLVYTTKKEFQRGDTVFVRL